MLLTTFKEDSALLGINFEGVDYLIFYIFGSGVFDLKSFDLLSWAVFIFSWCTFGLNSGVFDLSSGFFGLISCGLPKSAFLEMDSYYSF